MFVTRTRESKLVSIKNKKCDCSVFFHCCIFMSVSVLGDLQLYLNNVYWWIIWLALWAIGHFNVLSHLPSCVEGSLGKKYYFITFYKFPSPHIVRTPQQKEVRKLHLHLSSYIHTWIYPYINFQLNCIFFHLYLLYSP